MKNALGVFCTAMLGLGLVISPVTASAQSASITVTTDRLTEITEEAKHACWKVVKVAERTDDARGAMDQQFGMSTDKLGLSIREKLLLLKLCSVYAEGYFDAQKKR